MEGLGYYAARRAVLEHLLLWDRQAGILVVRGISEDYWAPLGVWVVGEVARKAMCSSPLPFDSLSSAQRSLDEF